MTDKIKFEARPKLWGFWNWCRAKPRVRFIEIPAEADVTGRETYCVTLQKPPEPEPVPVPSWDDAPDWANWVAQNAGGCWYWKEYCPHIVGNNWMPTRGRNEHALCGTKNPNWKDTLQHRSEPRPEPDPLCPVCGKPASEHLERLFCCAHCGSVAPLQKYGPPGFNATSYSVVCQNEDCYARVGDCATADIAIANWNLRA